MQMLAAALLLSIALPQSVKLVVQSDRIDRKAGEEVRKGAWTRDSRGNSTLQRAGEAGRDEAPSASFKACTDVRLGASYDLGIEYQGCSYPTRLTGVLPDPLFTPEYIRRNKGTAQFLR